MFLLNLFRPILFSLWIPLVFSQEPIIVPVGSNTAAISLSTGETLVYYQDSDNSIIQASLKMPFDNNYVPRNVIPGSSGIAKPGTPIAAIYEPAAGFSLICLYFLGPDGNGTHVRESCGASDGGFTELLFTGLGFTNLEGSDFLYAVWEGVANKQGNETVHRVGFVCSNGFLCEAVDEAEWTLRTFEN